MSKTVWRVPPTARAAVCVGRDVNFMPGDIVDTDKVPEAQLADWAKQGWIEEITVDNAPPPPVEKPIGPVQETEAATARGPWRHDPASLEGKGLIELNILVKETDVSVEAFDTVEEAIAHLSQDFV